MNEFGSEGAGAFNEVLKTNTTLNTLNFWGMFIHKTIPLPLNVKI